LHQENERLRKETYRLDLQIAGLLEENINLLSTRARKVAHEYIVRTCHQRSIAAARNDAPIDR